MHSGVLSAAVALERELRSGNRSGSVQTNRLGRLLKRVNFVGKGTKNRRKPPIFWGFYYLSFLEDFFLCEQWRKDNFFIGYWLSLSCFWRVNITRNRWVQWNVTYIFFGCEGAWSCLQGWLGAGWLVFLKCWLSHQPLPISAKCMMFHQNWWQFFPPTTSQQ